MATSEKRFSFTAEKLEKLVCPPSKRAAKDARLWFYDSKVDGLAFSITEGGARSFYLYRRIAGKPERIRIGTPDELNIEQARRRAGELNTAIAQGRNPVAEKKAAREKGLREATFGTLWDSYRSNWLIRKRPATIKAFDRLYKTYLSKWKNRPVDAIEISDIEKLKTEVGTKHSPTANRLLTIVSAMYRQRGHAFGLPRGFTPTAGVEDYPEKARERVLTAEELAAVMSAIDSDGNETVKDYFRMLIYTGQRRETVARMTWQDISLQSGTWRILGEKTKNGSALTIALIPEAMKIIKRRHDDNAQDTPFVFPGRSFTPAQVETVKTLRAAGESTRGIAEQIGLSQTAVMHMLSPRFTPRDAAPFNGAGRAWKRIITRAKIKHATIHDVRRTFCTNMIEAGVPLPIVSAAMGHRSTQTTAKHYAFASDKAVAKATRETMADLMANVKAIQNETKSA